MTKKKRIATYDVLGLPAAGQNSARVSWTEYSSGG
jgi:hypothetical protein